MMSEAILAWGGSPLLEGLRLWARHDSRRDTRAQACCPTWWEDGKVTFKVKKYSLTKTHRVSLSDSRDDHGDQDLNQGLVIVTRQKLGLAGDFLKKEVQTSCGQDILKKSP